MPFPPVTFRTLPHGLLLRCERCDTSGHAPGTYGSLGDLLAELTDFYAQHAQCPEPRPVAVTGDDETEAA